MMTCPELPDLSHAKKFYVTGTLRNEVLDTGVECSEVTDGNSCHYQCAEGYRLSGTPILICNSSGVWEGNFPNCSSKWDTLILLSKITTMEARFSVTSLVRSCHYIHPGSVSIAKNNNLARVMTTSPFGSLMPSPVVDHGGSTVVTSHIWYVKGYHIIMHVQWWNVVQLPWRSLCTHLTKSPEFKIKLRLS